MSGDGEPGSPHHLCAHLIVIIASTNAARQMYVLRCRAARGGGARARARGDRDRRICVRRRIFPSVGLERTREDGSACSLKHLPWMVEFTAPNGARLGAMDVLKRAMNVKCGDG